ENGGDENGTDDGTDDGIPVPTRIDTGEGATDGSQQLWLALGGVLSALGLGTLGYRMTRSQR
ncbi:hypothetical protein, partial [Phytoactinopolyspora endophytica]|uniref:hypothetical protein n=1 Tax=Phytoactinopolyspora endophytica TaxID=1642495 RepID=UPI0013EB4F7A